MSVGSIGKVVNLRCLAIIPPKVFIGLWCKYHLQGRTLHQLASRLGRSFQSVKARGQTLVNAGVILPPLEVGREPDIMEELQRIVCKVDCADGYPH